MAKTAAQLVPLKNQLSGSMSIFRFADSTDFAGGTAYQGFLYDNAGVSVTPNGTTGVQAMAGSYVPATPLAIPATPTLTTNNAGTAVISSGLNRYQTQQYYHVVFYDSSFRESQAMVVLANIPGPTTTGSVTFTFNWPAGAAGATIYKPYNSNGFYQVVIPNTIGSYTDTSSYSGGLPQPTGTTVFGPTQYLNGNGTYNVPRYPSPSPNASSTAPTIGPTTCVVTTSTTGGGFRASGYAYGLSAYNTLGETTLSAESAIANGTGSPWISGASAGVMNNVTLAASTASGTLPVGKYYYQVTAYTQNAAGSNGINNNGFTNGNSYANLGSGAGYTESLPSAEVNITTTGVGNVTLSWTNIPNAAGYVIYRSRDLPAPVVSAPTTATTGGTLPATTTYYYVVTATNPAGETIASNEVSTTTGGTSTNTISLSWAAVPNAYGYKIYRGTAAAGENTLIGTITNGATVTFTDTGAAGTGATPPATSTALGTGQATYIGSVAAGSTSFIDSGYTAYPAFQNSGFQPPKTYNAIYGSYTVQASWVAVTGAVGYTLWRNVPGAVANQTSMPYFTVTSGVTVTDSNNANGTRYSPQMNWSGSNNITCVGRYLQVPSNNAYVDKMGFTVSLVPGQSYRFGIYNQSNQSSIYTSGAFTPTSSALLYYEINPARDLSSYNGQMFYFYIQGANSTSTIAWGPNPKPGLVDNATITVGSENNTWAGYFHYNNYGTPNSSNQLGTPARDGNVPTQVYSETLCNLPMRINFRTPFTGTSINGARGTMLGGPRVPQYAYSNNTTYTTPIKSLVPTWNVLAPSNSQNNPVLFANRWVTVEVSTDGGSTWAALTNQSRYVFPSPVTQLQYRYTVPQNSMAMSFDRRLMTGLPTTDNTTFPNYNYYLTPDTNQVTCYLYQAQSNAGDWYMYSNGNILMGNVYSNWQYNFWSVQGFSVDVDMQMTCYFNQSGNIGLRFRNDGSNNSYGGYYAYIDNAGNWGLNRATYSNSATTLASGSGATNGILNQSHVLRVIAIGAHIQFFVDGIRVCDYTVTDTGNYLTGQNVGISGGRGIAQSFQATALTTASLANSPAWELEYVSAYLET